MGKGPFAMVKVSSDLDLHPSRRLVLETRERR